MCWAPIEMACMPVIIDDRLGAQTPAVVYAFVKSTASRARLSMFGVFTIESPYAPKKGEISSHTIQTIFGFFWPKDAVKKQKIIIIDC